AAADMSEAEQLQRLNQREQLDHDEIFFVGEVRQIGAPMIGSLRQVLDQPGKLLDRRIGQAETDAYGFALRPPPPVPSGLGRQKRVDLVDDLAKPGALRRAGTR